MLYPDRRFLVLFSVFLAISLLGTSLSAFVVLTHYGAPNNFVAPGLPGPGKPPSSPSLFVSVVRAVPIPLSIASWTALAGVFFIWRGRTRSMWLKLGFDQDVFKLFVKMRGAPTRLKLLQSLSSPKDRAELAEDLRIDWKAVDRHVQLLEKYGFVKERSIEGTAKFYELTPAGSTLLKLVDEQAANGR